MSVKSNIGNCFQTAVVPVKALAFAKSRLADRLNAEQRIALSLNLLKHVLGVVTNCSLDEVIVLGRDQQVASMADVWGVNFIEDEGRGLNQELKAVFDCLSEQNKSSIYIAADLPLLCVDDIEKMIGMSNNCEVTTICPSDRDSGTNGLLVPAGSALRPCLGKSSYAMHKYLSGLLRTKYAVCHSVGWGIDLDVSSDLDRILEIQPDFGDRILGPTTNGDISK